MKKRLTLILLSTVLLAMVSCKKQEIVQTKEKPSLKNFILSNSLPNIDTDGLITFSQTSVGNSSIGNIDVYGGFHHNTGAGFNNGTLTVENVNIPFNGQNSYTLGTNDSLQPLFASVWGSDLDIALTNSANNFTYSLPLPLSIKLLMAFPNGTSTQFSKSAGISVAWNEDQNNADKVYMKLTYQASPTISYLNANAPDIGVSIFFELDDNGSYILSPADLASLPSNSYVEISIFRGNLSLVTAGNANYDVLGYTSAQAMFILAP